MNKFTALTTGIVAAFALSGQAFADSTDSPYVFDSAGNPVMTPYGKCVHNGHGKLTPETAIMACDPDMMAKPKVEAAAPAALVEPPPAPEMKTITLTADTYFDFDKYNLKPAGKQALDKLISEMGSMNSIAKIKVVGYTDSIGTEKYNIGLSQRRAKTVATYLAAHNIPADKIETVGMGEADPIATNKTKVGRAKNRRVVVTTEGVGQ
ncbi:MAG: OmpA family protein [Halothiobacillus sp.]|jgi:OOP family OmpA-OmpF porin|uniref:OmpA family protein n=1 Tax=Halothiobacillus sp. TaxID=1891311 RepID=UPI002AD2D102|nr:OmpA family protein [Halothiobacillus sp.]MDA3877182.1 OmpA family protein [Halothiobacillus sp.]